MTNEFSKKGCGVLVGRFQSPELHDGHRLLIEAVLSRHSKVIIFLGISKALFSNRNPLDFIARQQMLEASFPQQLSIHALPDMPDDHDWSDELDKRIREIEPVGPVTLYGARDSFLPYYHGHFPVEEITSANTDISGTDIREKTSHEVIPSRDFRAGVIYAAMRKYPIAYPTVDIAVYKTQGTEILLGRKPNEKLFRFPGGFVDPTDENFEKAALREITEEAGPLTLGAMQYVGSAKIDDWRYRNSKDGIITQLFAAKWIEGTPTAQDDIESVFWQDTKTLFNNELLLVPEHRPLLRLLSTFTDYE
jgi:bifunctional NMN adenylyltransferase/nudix hydrolase